MLWVINYQHIQNLRGGLKFPSYPFEVFACFEYASESLNSKVHGPSSKLDQVLKLSIVFILTEIKSQNNLSNSVYSTESQLQNPKNNFQNNIYINKTG